MGDGTPAIAAYSESVLVSGKCLRVTAIRQRGDLCFQKCLMCARSDAGDVFQNILRRLVDGVDGACRASGFQNDRIGRQDDFLFAKTRGLKAHMSE